MRIDCTKEHLQAYFEMVCRNMDEKQDEFPINLDDVWPLVYPRKDHAVRDLTEKYIQDIDYQVFLKNGENPIGGRPTNDYRLTISCMEFLIARKRREVFEVYRQFFHGVRTGRIKPNVTVSNPQLQYVQTQLYLADALSDRLRLNEASRLGMYQSIAAPYNLAIPQYVPSQGVLKSASELLKENGYTMSAIKFNMLLVEQGYLETLTRPTSGGAVKRFKSITAKGKPYGENQVSPKNQKETQPQWYADRFGELYDIVTA